MEKTKLRKISEIPARSSNPGVIALLLEDHRAMRKLMRGVKSHRASDARVSASFSKLRALVLSHVAAEEVALLRVAIENPLFNHECLESIEEHHIHRAILGGIARISKVQRRTMQMKIFCEILEQHLDEEEEDLFPRFKKYAASSTRTKMGSAFIRARKKTSRGGKLGVLATRK